ncbi:zinc-dependent alcohol dehydrogenase [Aquirufa aurantiipilula]|uniref:zinc-dependent alcohol dehydrogenase n=1 Tax=Aquirufa aurantiipilula TaxID=2696561 RepID=UPI001CAA55A3|nr:alcohol dehydrogenase catalytic domain-containing protein [Aquirufa aurantiipilula]MBZ1327024.1 alcohol dehydrogenase catalytic domain-containing protein [Aquirufa aurantiipilula]
MKAAVLENPQHIQVKNLEKPVPQANEVLIRLTSTGICGSDVHLYLGDRLLPVPTVLGHEGIGFVEAIGAKVSGFQIGQRVVIEPNIPCGTCRFCQRGKGNICPNKQVVGVNSPGCFAEYICLNADFCWKLPDSISDEDAVCIEPLAVALHALHVSTAPPNASIAIFGLGAIGLLLCQLALTKGYRVWVKDLNVEKQALAEARGAGILPLEGLEAFLYEQEIAAIFDCVGVAKATNLILETAPRGSEIILVGLANELAQFVPLKIAREGISILPSIIYDHPQDFAETIELIAQDKIHPGQIISGRYPLDKIEEAMVLAVSGKASKVVVDMK